MADRYVLMWSGGKDSALALDRATSSGIAVDRLLNFHDAATGRVRFHATRIAMLQAQAEAMGIELRGIGTSWSEMEGRLLQELDQCRQEGFAGVVLGDIHLADVRAWYEERVTAAGLKHVEPIWGRPPMELVREFVESGGRAVITCVDLSRLDAAWLGRIIDQRFLEEIGATGIDPCGENGEYHSFAFQGPVFSHEVRWRPGATRSESGFEQLDVLPATP
ncbi:MAG: adenine nucleotide alpha hydrolase [Candidatus Dormibacteraeota bacterium]|nr:adenine nucleotide alpha hydrolase [Candidatus Dormibacteraeota bacterium]